MDTVLIHRVIKGDSDAFRQLYEQISGFAIRTAIAITRNPEMAKDAVQETFIRVYRNIGQYDPSKPFEPWFYRILTNECNRLLKKESKSPLRNDVEWKVHHTISAQNVSSSSDVYDAIQSLKDLYRIPIILKYLKDFTEKEIAEILDLNVNTVKTRLLKARKLLQQKLNGKEEG